MSLVAAALELRGIVTVALSVLPDLSRKLTAPRTLLVPFGLGTPVGPPGAAPTHDAVVRAALALAADPDVTPPAIRAWQPSPPADAPA
ncbi:MAG: hypothetical protein R2712_10600 [Vicinamibacterales bacterium]